MNSWISSHWSFINPSITSLPCTSIVTRAPNVNLSNYVKSCRTSNTISLNSATNCAVNSLMLWFWIANYADSVHLIILTARIVWAGHFLTHLTLSVVSASESLVILFNVEIITASISDNHLSTFPFFYP